MLGNQGASSGFLERTSKKTSRTHTKTQIQLVKFRRSLFEMIKPLMIKVVDYTTQIDLSN